MNATASNSTPLNANLNSGNYHQQQGQQEFGEIMAVTPHGFLIHQHEAGSVLGKQAFSCPYTPEAGDWISFIRSPDGQNYILNILRRNSEQPATMNAENGLRISSPETVSVQSGALEITNLDTQITTANTSLDTQKATVRSEQASIHSTVIESFADRMVQKVKDSFRVIERVEQVTAHDVLQTVKNLFLHRSKNTDINAESDVKINGDRIHMG